MSQKWTVLDVLNWTSDRFAKGGVDKSRLEAEVLLAHALGKDRVALYTHFDQPMSEQERECYRELVKGRLAGKPIAYLIGQREFWSLPFHVSEKALIPRPDTECLVEAAQERLPKDEVREVLDIGTGTGAISVAIAHDRPLARISAVDICADALALAKRNVERHAMDERIELFEGDLYSPLDERRFDMIVSNPPYIPSDELPTLMTEVKREPQLALDGGPDGLKFIAPIIDKAPEHLKEGGWLIIEHAQDQGFKLRERMSQAAFLHVETIRDLAGKERVTLGQRPL